MPHDPQNRPKTEQNRAKWKEFAESALGEQPLGSKRKRITENHPVASPVWNACDESLFPVAHEMGPESAMQTSAMKVNQSDLADRKSLSELSKRPQVPHEVQKDEA